MNLNFVFSGFLLIFLQKSNLFWFLELSNHAMFVLWFCLFYSFKFHLFLKVCKAFLAQLTLLTQWGQTIIKIEFEFYFSANVFSGFLLIFLQKSNLFWFLASSNHAMDVWTNALFMLNCTTHSSVLLLLFITSHVIYNLS